MLTRLVAKVRFCPRSTLVTDLSVHMAIVYPTALARSDGARPVGISAMPARPLWRNVGLDAVRIYVSDADLKVTAKAFCPPDNSEVR